MKSLLLLILCVGTLSGCATEDQTLATGNANLTETRIDTVKVGMDADEVLAVMGDPDETMNRANGGEEWLYHGSEGEWLRPSAFSKKTTTIRAKVLSVMINSENIVTNVSYDELQEKTTKPF